MIVIPLPFLAVPPPYATDASLWGTLCTSRQVDPSVARMRHYAQKTRKGIQTMTHRLIITDDSEDPWYVEHDTSCPTADLYGGSHCFDYVCLVGRELANAGIGRLDLLPTGEYEIEYWQESRAVDRYGTLEVVASGLRAVVDDDSPLIYTDLDGEYWGEMLRKAKAVVLLREEASQVQIDPDWLKKIIRDGRKTGLPWKEES
jgi:hypothetical protein